MAVAWDEADEMLRQTLVGLLGIYAGATFHIDLYQNDYVPVPGASLSDFEIADYPGYDQQDVDFGDWGTVSVTDHIASSVNGTVNSFVGSSGTWDAQTIYGYVVTDEDGNYFWSERFSVPIDMVPEGEIRITPRLRVRTYPYT